MKKDLSNLTPGQIRDLEYNYVSNSHLCLLAAFFICNIGNSFKSTVVRVILNLLQIILLILAVVLNRKYIKLFKFSYEEENEEGE